MRNISCANYINEKSPWLLSVLKVLENFFFSVRQIGVEKQFLLAKMISFTKVRYGLAALNASVMTSVKPDMLFELENVWERWLENLLNLLMLL